MGILKHAIGLALGIALSRVFIAVGSRLFAIAGFAVGFMHAEGSLDLVTPGLEFLSMIVSN